MPLATLPPAGTPVLAAISGGVDSSLAAWLLLQAGCRVEGIFMKNWDEDDDGDECTAAEDYASAQAACDTLGIPLKPISFAPEYWDLVFEPLLHDYRAGRTPNPDVDCNRHIKFGALLQHSRALGFDWLATGHYARIEQGESGPQLLRGLDSDKDQSYFLHRIEQRALANTLFPIGGLRREQVRQMAQEAGLPNWDRRGSTGICFIGERRFGDFLNRWIDTEPGDIVALDGTVVGRHKGASLYTLGQRKGLGIGGRSGGAEQPWYVVDTDVVGNRVTVAQGDHPRLYRSELGLGQAHWIGAAPELPAQLTARIRYRHPDRACELRAQGEQQLRVRFAQPERAPALSQYCVFYDGERCLGGAPIADLGAAISPPQPAQSALK